MNSKKLFNESFVDFFSIKKENDLSFETIRKIVVVIEKYSDNIVKEIELKSHNDRSEVYKLIRRLIIARTNASFLF